ncbi:helix-turn-helix domain-containing protein [Aliivibrio fischeri]|uniref:helix-turn-helix domain-containing protein n=1 Tax=Aliivibrio fischeri TaxID=668 RepID=UPI0007C5C9FA|nr:helix-turn-helix domain-containing protein [Aliivibrio fischeri]
MKQKSILARNIEQRKYDLGITTNIEVARKSGVSRAVITNIGLHPNKSIMLDSAVLLAKALDCRLEWLATGEGPINLDDVERHNRLRYGAVVIRTSELESSTPEELLKELYDDQSRERVPCPAGNSFTTFIVRLNQDIGKYAAGGMMYFDYEKTPITGSVVLAKTAKDAAPEIMEYTKAHNRSFLKSLSEDLPAELKFIEITEEMAIISTLTAYAIT